MIIAPGAGKSGNETVNPHSQISTRFQASILLALKPHGEGLTVVGDDAQSILKVTKDGSPILDAD